MKGKILGALAAATVLLLSGCASDTAPGVEDLKIQSIGSMAVLGDSISVATATCGYNSTCNQNSWATGTNEKVNSQAELLAADQGTPVTTYNDAVAGAKAIDLAAQVSLAVQQKPDYAAILIGANDFCAADISKMTSPTAYRQQLASVIASFKQYLPDTYVFMASVPDPSDLYEANRGSAAAKQVWSYASICQSLLASPADNSAQAKQRRELVRQRAEAYNSAIANVCNEYDKCHYDNGAIFNKKYSASDISDLDYFHPSVQGQRELADLTWNEGGVRDWLRKATNPVTDVIVPS